MSSPESNLEKEKRRHKGPLVGIGLAVLFAAVLLGALALWVAYQGNEPGNGEPRSDEDAAAEEQVDGS